MPITSSSLRSVGYDASSRTLEVEFASGAVYRYYDFPAFLYARFLRAASKGRFLNRHIRTAYPYARVGRRRRRSGI